MPEGKTRGGVDRRLPGRDRSLDMAVSMKDNLRKITPVLGMLGLAAAAVFFFAGNADEDRPSLESVTGRPVRTDSTVIRLQNLRSEVTSAGVPSQRIHAAFGELDEEDKILDLEGLDVTFYRDGTQSGAAECGKGRIWLKDSKEEQARRNDVSMSDGVDFHSADGWMLRAPEMRFKGSDSMIYTDAGFVKQKKLDGGGYLVGKGQSFQILLDQEAGTLREWTEHGSPVVLEKTDKPGLVD